MAFTTVDTKYPSPDTILLDPSDADVSGAQVDPTFESGASTGVTSGVNPIPSFLSLKQGALVVDWDSPEDPTNPRK